MPARPNVALSVLDLSPVAAGSSGAVSLHNSLDLARLADRLGYTRYWVAEHHNLPAIASSAPDIMIGQIAATTKHIRVGSGGVMLPNHAPLMVAERFKVLEALFPGRIDLGLGRARGTDPVTSFALRRRQDAGEDDFLERFQELLLFESNAFPEGHPFRSVRAMPQDVALPPIWLLGSSGYSAQLAAGVGTGFSFAHHFADHDAVGAMLKRAEIVFDKFHIAKHLGEAVDRVRRREHKVLKAEGDERLTGTKYDWLRNPASMDQKQRREFAELRRSELKTARAWALRETAMGLYDYVYEKPARKHFQWWYSWAVRSRLQPIKEVARMLKRRFENIITYLRHRITNAASESLNAKIQWVKYTARGFRNKQNFIHAIYFHCGGLDLAPSPTK